MYCPKTSVKAYLALKLVTISSAYHAFSHTVGAGRSLSKLALIGVALLSMLFAATPILANEPAGGGYVDGNTVLTPAKSINTGGVSITPTFNNDQFNDKLLVGTVNNDPIRTPSTADPVSTVSGNNYHDETDLMIRGRNGLNMVFTRTYNSAPSATKVDRGLGFGWTHSYLMRLKSNDFGDCPNCSATQKPENTNSKTSSISYTDERGGEQNYLVNETSFAVISPKGLYDTLVLDSPAAGQHTINFRNGVKYIFETPTGNLKTTPNIVSRLKFIDDAWGNRLTFAYDANGRLSTVTDNLAIAGRTGLVLTYDANGRLKDVSDWTARKWRYTYDASGNLRTMINPLAQALTYSYDAPKHLLTTITKPLQRDGLNVETRFRYYENGRTFQQTNSYGVGDTLDYDLYRKSTRVTDARGYVREYFYDDNGRMTKLTEPDGAVLLFENQNDAIRSKKYDALGYATTYSYRADKAFTGASDSFGNVTREQDALGNTIDTTYAALDQVATVKDKRGTIATTTYASSTAGCDYINRPKESRINTLNGVANVLLSSYCWNSNATLNYSRAYIDATRYRETRLTYEAASNGLNVSQEQIVGMPSGITITKTTTYDTLGRKKTETLQRRTSPTNAALINLTTSYDYDALDRVIKTTDSLGNEAINNFDANGQLWKTTHRYKKPDASFDVRDVSTRLFDAADRLLIEADAEGNVTSNTYDAAGNVIAVMDAENHTTRFAYDEMNRRTAVIDATGYRTDTTLTLRGDVVAMTNANNETVKFEIDALGRKTAAIDAKGYRSEFQYDQNNNLTCTIDANAQSGLQPKNTLACSQSQQYDELNRVVKTTDALNGETRFTYDLLGNRLTITDAESKPYSFAYDDLGRLVSETDHSAKTSTYLLDEAGNPYQTTNRLAEISRYTYDNANRLTRIDYAKDNSAETFGYDAAGNKASSANSLVGYSFIYDRLNRLTKKLDSRNAQLSFTYDKANNLLTKTTYQNTTTSYLYNAANRLVSLSNIDYLQADYQLDPAGRVLSRVSNSGARTLTQYDANGWVTKLTQYDAANNLVSDTTYTRDRIGNILTQTNSVGASTGTTTYTYDALYRLKTADYPAIGSGSATVNDEAYTYDKVGNRTTHTKGSITLGAAGSTTRYYNYTAGTNRLTDIRLGSATGTVESGFTNDLEGRLTQQTGSVTANNKTLIWDAKSRLKTLTKSGATETYGYDPMDYRIRHSNVANGQLDYYLEGEHLESVEQNGQLTEKYFRGASTDELIAAYLKDSDGKSKPYQFHHDNVTSTTQVTGHNGGTLQSTTYSAFGTSINTTGASPNRLKYTGREEDGTGCYYYRARYYCQDIGRFISEDPKGFEAGINFYAYVDNNPVNANDPSGMDAYLGAKPIDAPSMLTNNAHHTVLVLMPNSPQDFANKTGWQTLSNGQMISTLSGQPKDGFSLATLTGQSKLNYTPNWSNDQIQNLTELQRIQTPKGMTDTQFISGLIKSAGSYQNNAQYNLVPEKQDGYNSNSFTAGVISKAGGTPPTINYSAPGYSKPLPISNGANGGFLLYPNKPNNNYSQSVYSK